VSWREGGIRNWIAYSVKSSLSENDRLESAESVRFGHGMGHKIADPFPPDAERVLARIPASRRQWRDVKFGLPLSVPFLFLAPETNRSCDTPSC